MTSRVPLVLAGLAATALATALTPVAGAAQLVAAEPVLRGRALVGDSALRSGTVVLHHMSVTSEGQEVDSVPLRGDGSFSLELPNVPDPAREDIFFASISHDGVFYFGAAITEAVQLDSIYTIQVYETVAAPAGGAVVPLQLRTVFLEPTDGRGWVVSDVFRLVNENPHTLVGDAEGVVWRYPLAEGATDFQLGHLQTGPDGATFENGDIVLHAALSPGEEMLVVRYMVDDPFVTLPTPGTTDLFELLVREPAPPLKVDGLTFVQRTSVEEGTTYLHYRAQSLALPSISIVPGDEPRGPPPVEWAAILIAMLLAGVGLYAVRGGKHPATGVPPRPEASRHDLLVAVARLDVYFQATPDPSPAERAQYRRRRAELLERIREAS